MVESQESDFVKRINEIAEELAHGNPKSRGKSIIELRKLCGKHHTVPKSYQLEGIKKEGNNPQHRHPTGVTEIWKGRHGDKVVGLKIIISKGEQAEGTKSRFYKEVVLMMQLKHENVLPFYGVLPASPEFCLVFPWYENGNIMDYLKKKPNANRFDLLQGAVRGLLFVHTNRLVHGALRPSHILIDDNGAARIATGGRSSIVAVPDTSIAGHSQSGVDGIVEEYRYSAPELWLDDSYTGKLLITKESDVYAMAMVAYQVLTGDVPFFGYSNTLVLERVQAGERPSRPFDGIADPVWEFLVKCWSRAPTKRPPTAEVRDAFYGFLSLPQATRPPDGRPPKEDLPGRLKLKVQGIRISLNKPKHQEFSVKFKYGNGGHTTSWTKPVAGDEYPWDSPESWLIEVNRQCHGQLVSFEVFRLTKYRKVKVCATGSFSLQNNVNKDIQVKLEAPKSTGHAVLKTSLTETF